MTTPNQPRASDINETKTAGRKRPAPQATANHETNLISEENGFFVYYRYIISIEGRQSRSLRIYVNEGDNIDSIIRRIKNENILFAAVGAE